MHTSYGLALIQCERANAGNNAYRPHTAFAGATNRLLEDGLVSKGATGGFWLTSNGVRALSKIKTTREPRVSLRTLAAEQGL